MGQKFWHPRFASSHISRFLSSDLAELSEVSEKKEKRRQKSGLLNRRESEKIYFDMFESLYQNSSPVLIEQQVASDRYS